MSAKTNASKCLARDSTFGLENQQTYVGQQTYVDTSDGYQQLNYTHTQVEAANDDDDEYQMPSFQQQETSSHQHYQRPDQAIAISNGPSSSYLSGGDETLYADSNTVNYQQEWRGDRCQPQQQHSNFANHQLQIKTLEEPNQPDYNNNNSGSHYLSFTTSSEANYHNAEQQEHSSFQQQLYSSSEEPAPSYQPAQDIYYDYENQPDCSRSSTFLSTPTIIQQQQQVQNYQETECFRQEQQFAQTSHYVDEQQHHLANSSYQVVSSLLTTDLGESARTCFTQRASTRVTRRGRPRKKGPKSKSKVNGKLWEFIRDLLLSERTNPSFIRWERREDGVFKFVQSDKVAKMWGERKQNPKMTYEKLSRAMRYYYKSKVLLPVFGRRLVYKFGPNATGWMADGDCAH